MRRVRSVTIVSPIFRRQDSSLAFESYETCESPDYEEHLVEEAVNVIVHTPGPISKPRFDWRLRSRSRRNPGGLIDPPPQLFQKVHYPRRTKFTDGVPISVGEPLYNEICAYKLRFLDLLAAEQETEMELIRSRLESWSQEKLQQDGYCLSGLSSFWLQSTQFGKPVAAFLIGPGVALPFHRLDNGTQVLLSRGDPLNHLSGQGSVIGSSETEIRVSFDDKLNLEGESWRLDLFNTDVAYARMRAAINNLSMNPEKMEPYENSIMQGTYLRDVLLRGVGSDFGAVSRLARVKGKKTDAKGKSLMIEIKTKQAESRVEMSNVGKEHTLLAPGLFASNQLIHSWAQRYSAPGEPVVVEGDPDLSMLNPAQRRAVAMMVGERVGLIQGPPGTGKTKTIIEAVKLLKLHWQIPHPLLVCTYTNIAVDNLVAGLVAASVKPLRIGYPAKVQPALLQHTLDAQLEAHPRKATWEAVVKEVDRVREYVGRVQAAMMELKEKGETGTPKYVKLLNRLERLGEDLKRKKGKAWGIKREMVLDIMNGADVICTTCITSATMVMNEFDFPIVFIDEASMSTEPATLIPLMKGCRHVSLIGDHKQLPPVITSKRAQTGGLGVSLFERLIEEGDTPSIMLNMQYRMHPSLSRFPSGEFYDFSLYDGTVHEGWEPPLVSSRLRPEVHEVAGVVRPEGISRVEMMVRAGMSGAQPGNMAGSDSVLGMDGPERRASVIFLDHAGGEAVRDRSRVNYDEARIVCAVVEDLLMCNPNMSGHDIGIIAPYAAQISLLTRLLKQNKVYTAHLQTVLGPLRAMQVQYIEIKTVDGFEGREKDVIVFSTVRNNGKGEVGFLADKRRMNVGLTRAKRGLFVVGSVGTLGGRKESAGAGIETRRERGQKEERAVWGRYVEWLVREGAVKKLNGEALQKMLLLKEGSVRR